MSQNDTATINTIPTRTFGKTGIEVTVTGLGGEGILRTYGQEDESSKVIREAFAQGINYFDCARAYAGSEMYYGQFWSRHQGDRAEIFQAGKPAVRSKNGALADLDQTLGNIGIDHLDLLQIHDVRTERDLDIGAGQKGLGIDLKGEKILDEMKSLLMDNSMCVLATSSDNRPHCSLMAYITDDQAKNIYMATLNTSRKYKNIEQNPHVSLLVDSRVFGKSDSGAGTIKALTVTGICSVVRENPERELILARMKRRIPRIREIAVHPNVE